MPAAVVDINETTLDLAPVRLAVDDLLGPEGGYRVWFPRLIQLSMTHAATRTPAVFTDLARDALHAVAATGGRALPADAWPRVADAFASLTAYPDVPHGLERLRGAGWTVAALTNTPREAVAAQLEGAGLGRAFQRILSVEQAGRFKPSEESYRHALAELGVAPADAWMVACHDWDLAGARAVGMRTAFVRRPAMSYAASFPPPDLAVEDFEDLAAALGG